MQFSDKLRTRVAFNNSWSKTEGLLPSQNGTDNPTTNYTKGTRFPNYTLSGQADYIVSPKLFVGFKGGYFSNDTHDFNVPDVPKFIFSTGNVGMAGVPASEQHPASYTNVLSNTATTNDTLIRKYFQADVTYYAGGHQIKGGVQVDRRSENILSGELEHRVTIRWGQPLSTGTPLTQGPFGYYSIRSNGVAPKQGLVTTGNVSRT